MIGRNPWCPSLAVDITFIKYSITGMSFPYNLNQNPFAAAAIKLAVKDLFPGAKIKLAIGDRHHDLATRMLFGCASPGA